MVNIDIFGIFGDVNAFLILFIFIGSLIGFASEKFTIGVYGGLLVFTYIFMETDLWIFDAIGYLVLFIIIAYMGLPVVFDFLERNENTP